MKNVKHIAKQVLINRIQPMLLPEEEYQEGMSIYTFQIDFSAKNQEEIEGPENYNKLGQGENQ